jgi:RNA polymerase sigma factor (sigma-70 family)
MTDHSDLEDDFQSDDPAQDESPPIDRDLINQYLYEISQRELLTRQQEFYLGIVIQGNLLIGVNQPPVHLQTLDLTGKLIKLYLEILMIYDQFLDGVARLSVTPPSIQSLLWDAVDIQLDPMISSSSALLNWLTSELWTPDIERAEADQECASKAVEILTRAYLMPRACLERMVARTSRANRLPAPRTVRRWLKEYINMEEHFVELQGQYEWAKDILIRSNLRLVVANARDSQGRGLPMLDLIQEGNLGLMHAIEKFDPTRGNRFSTYSTWWIRQAVSRAVSDYSRLIRLPVHVGETLNRILRIRSMLTSSLGREPDSHEIALEGDFLDPEITKSIMDCINEDAEIPGNIQKKWDRAARKVEEILRYSLDPISLDSPVKGDSDSTYEDFTEDESAETPFDVVVREVLKELVDDLLSVLLERERQVLEMRFGLRGGREYTLEEVGKHFKVTRERIRQIEAKAIRKLRRLSLSKDMRDFIV